MITRPADLAPYLQHTLIAIGTTREEAIRHAEQAVEHGFDAAMVAGSCVQLTAEVLAGTGVKVASAVDFPTTGAMTTHGKAAEAAALARCGATEIDIGVRIGALKDGDHRVFRRDIEEAVHASGVPIKVMLELALLTADQKEVAVELAVEAGVAYVKNASSGSVEKASPESIRFLVERVPDHVGVKASGGIATFEHANSLVDAGASLIGSSACVDIVTGRQGAGDY